MAFGILTAVVLLILSNVFMTFAWYGHLGNEGGVNNVFLEFLGSLKDRPWFVAAIISWFVAFFEYLLQVPANRAASPYFSRAQLKMLQEILSLAVFAGIAIVYWREKLRLDFLWAGLCILGAVFFVFRHHDDRPAKESPAAAAVSQADPPAEPH